MSSPFGMAVPPASPFTGSLFKAKDARSGEGQPIAPPFISGSPFSTPGTQASVGLTVGDVLAQLPPEIVRANYLPAEQPIAIAQNLIDAALSNGQAAIPIFEVYRVCPALFQTPISPQDPRMVPLPASKLPTMIAASQRGGAPAQNAPAAMGASPFGSAPQSPFGTLQPAQAVQATPPPLPNARPSSGVSLPPRREPGTLPFATMNSVPQGTLEAPSFAQPAMPAPSPFGMAEPVPAAQSPFTMPPAQPQVAPSPFSLGAPAPATPPAFPFGTAQTEASPPPFGALFPQAQAPAFAFGQAQPEAAVSAPPVQDFRFGVAATPPDQAAPQPFALMEPKPPAAPPVQPQAASPLSPSQMAGPLKLSLASLLKGYSANDLGFDPNIVPSWIVTNLSASMVQEQINSGSSDMELGMLIDGTTDLGFRNVLATAHRNVRIPLPMNELFQGLPAPESRAFPVSVQKPAEAAPFAPAAPPAFMQEAAPPAPVPPPPGFPPANPFAAAKAAAIAQSGPLSPAAKLAMSGPIKPRENALFDFKAPAPPAELPPAPVAFSPSAGPATQARQMVSFDPFASSVGAPAQWTGKAASPSFPPAVGSEGFSSEQLFGGPPAPMPSPIQAPTPVMPAFPEPRAESTVPQFSGFTSLPGIPPPLPEPVPLRPATNAPAVPAAFSFPQAIPQMPLPQHPMGQGGALPPAFVPMAPAASAPMPPPMVAAPAAPRAGAMSSFGITPVASGDTEQTMLRALLGVNEHLTVGRVVEIMAAIPGVAACSCVSESGTISLGGTAAAAQDFQKQAGDLARNIQALAPMIGISGAETFSINTTDRLMTFSFHSPIAIGVLHQDSDLASGLRDKITLVGRELSRLVVKNGGRIS